MVKELPHEDKDMTQNNIIDRSEQDIDLMMIMPKQYKQLIVIGQKDSKDGILYLQKVGGHDHASDLEFMGMLGQLIHTLPDLQKRIRFIIGAIDEANRLQKTREQANGYQENVPPV